MSHHASSTKRHPSAAIRCLRSSLCPQRHQRPRAAPPETTASYTAACTTSRRDVLDASFVVTVLCQQCFAFKARWSVDPSLPPGSHRSAPTSSGRGCLLQHRGAKRRAAQRYPAGHKPSSFLLPPLQHKN